MTFHTRTAASLLAMLLCLVPSTLIAQPAESTSDEPGVTNEPVGAFQGAGFLIFQTPDGNFKWWLDGRVMLDAATYMNSDNQLANGAEIRRARAPRMNTQLWKTWVSQFDVEFIQDNNDRDRDMWVGYTGVHNNMVKIGNFRAVRPRNTDLIPLHLFIERPLIDNFSPDRHIGAAYSAWGPRWQGTGGPVWSGGRQHRRLGRRPGLQVDGRFTALPVKTTNGLVHLGIAGSYTTPNAATNANLSDANQMRLRARPETHVNRGRFIDTGKMSNVDHQTLLGLEAAALLVRCRRRVNTTRRPTPARSTLVAPSFDGWYAFVSWFPTGDHRPYDATAGEFDRVIPKNHRGALELLARYSTANLNDANASIFGGKEGISTIGATWYANPNVRLMLNYSFVNNDRYAKGDPRAGQRRLQRAWARFQLIFWVDHARIEHQVPRCERHLASSRRRRAVARVISLGHGAGRARPHGRLRGFPHHQGTHLGRHAWSSNTPYRSRMRTVCSTSCANDR